MISKILNTFLVFFVILIYPIFPCLSSDDEEKEKEIEIDRPSSRRVYVNQSSIELSPQPSQQKLIEDLRKEAHLEEEKGNILKAAQTMDRVIKLDNPPLLEDVCYALALNQKAPPQPQRQLRPQQLARKIAQILNVDEHASEIEFVTGNWNVLRPYLDYLIKGTVANSSYEQRTFRYKILREHFNEHVSWRLAYMNTYNYPISISGGNRRVEGEKNEQGVYEAYEHEFYIRNYTYKEQDARHSFSYRFHGGELDLSALNPRTFYNLMVRAGFKKEDFEEGKHGYQDKVFVKPVQLQGNDIPRCIEEIKKVVLSTFKKAKHPYVTFVFEPSSQALFTANELYAYENGQLNRYFFYDLEQIPSTIVETRENRLYFCFTNNKRKTLDLHGMAYEEAFVKVRQFIQERYDHFEEECKIITGRGNHINAGGRSGILHESLKEWSKRAELKLFIRSVHPVGEGIYRVNLHKPNKLILTSSDKAAQRQQIIKNILRLYQAGANRLLVTHSEKKSADYLESLFILCTVSLIHQHHFTDILQWKRIEDAFGITWYPNLGYQEESI